MVIDGKSVAHIVAPIQQVSDEERLMVRVAWHILHLAQAYKLPASELDMATAVHEVVRLLHEEQ